MSRTLSPAVLSFTRHPPCEHEIVRAVTERLRGTTPRGRSAAIHPRPAAVVVACTDAGRLAWGRTHDLRPSPRAAPCPGVPPDRTPRRRCDEVQIVDCAPARANIMESRGILEKGWHAGTRVPTVDVHRRCRAVEARLAAVPPGGDQPTDGACLGT